MNKRRNTDQLDLFAPGQGDPAPADPPPSNDAAEAVPARPVADYPTDHLLDALNAHLYAEPPDEPPLIEAMVELGERCETRAVPYLIRACRRFAAFDAQHPAREVFAALDALARIGPASAVEPLIDLIHRGLFGPASTAAALACFGLLKCRRAAELVRPGLLHVDPRVRQAACVLAASLHLQADAEAVAALLHDPDRGVAKSARLALGELGYKPAREALEDLLDRATPIDIPLVARALIAVADEDTPVKLARAAERCDEEGRCAIVQALGAIDAPTAVPQLVRLSCDSRPAVRLAVIEALSRHDDSRIAPALGALTRDADEAVREAAEAVLKDLDATSEW